MKLETPNSNFISMLLKKFLNSQSINLLTFESFEHFNDYNDLFPTNRTGFKI